MDFPLCAFFAFLNADFVEIKVLLCANGFEKSGIDFLFRGNLKVYILALDTTAKTACAALCETNDGAEISVKSQCTVNSTATHSESLLPMADFCLKEASVSFDDIGAIAVSNGPGSFTGVRIGVSAVKGLAFGKDNIKCVPVSALYALALNVSFENDATVICACMDARRNQFYNALFMADGKGNLLRLCDDRALSADELYSELCEKYKNADIVLVGDGAYLAYKLLCETDRPERLNIRTARADLVYQNAYSVARAANEKLNSEPDGDYSSESLLPMYLRLSQAERERNEKLKNGADAK